MPLSVFKPSNFIFYSTPIVWGGRGRGNLMTRGGMLHRLKGGMDASASIHLSVSICHCVSMSVSLSVHSSVCPSFYLYVCISVCFPVCNFVRSSVCLSVQQFHASFVLLSTRGRFIVGRKTLD